MKRMLLAVVSLFGLFVGAVANEIDWGTTSGFRIYDNNGVTALSTNVVAKTSTNACLVQLVYAGLNGVADLADNLNLPLRPTGTTSDDMVVAWSYIGAGEPPSQSSSAGRFARSGAGVGYNNTSYANGSVFFIRALDVPAADFASGAIPAGSYYYGNSQLFTVNGNGPIPINDVFSLTSNFSTLLPIPEPGAVMFAMAGLGLLIGYRRYKLFYR